MSSARRPNRLPLADAIRGSVKGGELPAPAAPASLVLPTRDTPPIEDAAPRSSYHAATRAGKKKVTANLNPAEHKRLKHLSVELDRTTEALLAEAIRDLFTKYERR